MRRSSYAVPLTLKVVGSAGKKDPAALSTRHKAKSEWHLQLINKIVSKIILEQQVPKFSQDKRYKNSLNSFKCVWD